MFPRQGLVENESPVTIPHFSYSGLNRQLDLLYHLVRQFPPRKVMRSLVGVYFWMGAAEVVDAPLNCTASCQRAIWSLRPFQLTFLWRWSCDGKSTRIASPPSRTTAYRNCTAQPSAVILSCWRWGRVRCFCLGIYEGSLWLSFSSKRQWHDGHTICFVRYVFLLFLYPVRKEAILVKWFYSMLQFT